MGHSDIGVTMNTYTHTSFDDAKQEVERMQEEQGKTGGKGFGTRSKIG